MAADATVFGLPLLNTIQGIPLSAMVIVKCLDERTGGTLYLPAFTDNLPIVEAIGMVRFAQIFLDKSALKMGGEE